ncbi:MAG: hypothetical protein IT186_10975 [Acidobacteria bacterium]|nr:hypothetical protein [Acidobacteriota bacterium]
MVVQGIVLTPTYLKFIDAPLYGAWLATGNVIAWLSLIDPGISKLLIQRVAFLDGSGRAQDLPDTMHTGLVIGWVLTALSVIAWPFSSRLAGLLTLPAWQIQELGSAVLLMLVATSVLLVSAQPVGILLGLQRSGAAGILNTIATVLAIVSSLVLIYSGCGLSSIPAGFLLRNVVVFIGATVILEHVRKSRGLSPGRWSRDEGRRYFALSAVSYVERIASTVITQVDTFLGAKVISPMAAAQFGLTGKAIGPVQMFSERIAAALIPGMANLAGERDPGKLGEISRRILTASAFSLSIGLGAIVALNGPFVSLWVGPHLFGGQRLTLLLALSATMGVLTSSLAEITFAAGAIAQATLGRVVEGVLKLGLQIWMATRWGLEGIVVGGILAQAMTTAWYYPVLLARRTRTATRDEIRALGFRFLQAATLLTAGWAGHLAWSRAVTTWTWLSFSAAAVLTGSVLIVIGLAVFPEVRRMALPLLRSTLSARRQETRA